MSKIQLVKSDPLFMQEVDTPVVTLEKEDYLLRLNLLVERIKTCGYTHAVIYGDREHFSHIEYFTSYDCRFEEALFIVNAAGETAILVGNEGLAYSEQIPYPIRRVLYQNFSLQGQPKDQLRPLSTLFSELGISRESKVGLVGVKYFESSIEGDPVHTFDLPSYILDGLYRVCPQEQVFQFGQELTGYPDGIRICLHSAKEIAWAESAGNRAARAVQRMFKHMKPGMSELEVSASAGVELEPLNVHPMINFGARSVSRGLKSPLQSERLALGQVCGLCYSVRGNLTSKISVAAYDLNSWADELKPYYETFYQAHFAAMAAWYESAKIGVCCGDVYKAVYRHISHEEHGITLNPGHSTGTEEWLNSAFCPGSSHKISDGEFVQVDIIASGSNPVRTSICEDAVVFAGERLRAQLREQFPDVYARILARQKAMREVLGIQISDELLPMSNLNGVYYPFMLNLDTVFACR